MMMVAGLVSPTGGEIVIDAKSPGLTDVGIVFQRDALLEWRTVLDNVLLQIDVRRRARSTPHAGELLARAGLSGFENYYPWELSGGMRQRVALCRALIHDPSLLLMDEPFGALDALTREQMNLDLQRIWLQNRKTTLFITHSISEAVFLSDRVIVMSPRPGRMASDIRIDLPRPRRLAVREARGVRRLRRADPENLPILRTAERGLKMRTHRRRQATLAWPTALGSPRLRSPTCTRSSRRFCSPPGSR